MGQIEAGLSYVDNITVCKESPFSLGVVKDSGFGVADAAAQMPANQDEKVHIRYHTSLQGTKQQAGCQNTCCETSSAGPGPCVNLFAPSEIIWQHGGGENTLTTATDFPHGSALSMTIHLRVPPCATGDKIELVLPMLYGPVLMALARELTGLGGVPHIAVSQQELPGLLAPVATDSLDQKVEGYRGYTYKPYWELRDETSTCFPVVEA